MIPLGMHDTPTLTRPGPIDPPDPTDPPGTPVGIPAFPPEPRFNGPVIYVSPSGGGSGNSPSSRTTLPTAFAQMTASSSNDFTVLLASGLYSIPSTLECTKRFKIQAEQPVLTTIDTTPMTSASADWYVTEAARLKGMNLNGARIAGRMRIQRSPLVVVEGLYFPQNPESGGLSFGYCGSAWALRNRVRNRDGHCFLTGSTLRSYARYNSFISDLAEGPEGTGGLQNSPAEHLTDYGFFCGPTDPTSQMWAYDNLFLGHNNQTISAKSYIGTVNICRNLIIAGDGEQCGLTPFMAGQSGDEAGDDRTIGETVFALNTLRGGDFRLQICDCQTARVYSNNFLQMHRVLWVWLSDGNAGRLSHTGPRYPELIEFYDNYILGTAPNLMLCSRGRSADTLRIGPCRGPGGSVAAIQAGIDPRPPVDPIANPQTLEAMRVVFDPNLRPPR